MKLFAWDFHGVLEKDNDLKVQHICETLLDKKIELSKIREFYGLPWGDYFRRLKPTEDEEELKELIERAIKLSMELTGKPIKPNDHAEEVLEKIKKSGDMNIVVSNTRTHRLDEFLIEVGLQNFFEEKVGIDAGFEIGNQSVVDYKGQKMLKLRKKYAPKNMIVIGDSEADIEAGMIVNAITFMFDPWDRHLDTKADHRIKDLREVLKVYE